MNALIPSRSAQPIARVTGRTIAAFVILAIGMASTASAAIPVGERNDLIALYFDTQGGGWTDNTGWCSGSCPLIGPPLFNTSGTECSWYGVTCSGNHVVAINLPSNNLVGTLPVFTSLSSLATFDASSNHLTGNALVPSVSMQLATVDLSHNRLDGVIPPIAALANLQHYNVYDNALTGSIPQLAGLTQLMDFSVDTNKLSGTPYAYNNQQNSIPQLTSLISLRSFDVSNNPLLTGSIPSLVGLTNLQAFNAYSDNLTGSIPCLSTGGSCSSGLANLVAFDVHNNPQLTGLIPSLTGLTNLTYFYASSDNLTGSIPPLAGLTNLVDFSVDDNPKLTGPIPPLSGVGLNNLTYFTASSDNLTGTIPPLTGLTKLHDFEVDSNNLTGSVPLLTGLTNLTYFFVGRNKLTGPVPVAPSSLSNASLCPNPLDTTPQPTIDPAWNLATGATPWWATPFVGNQCDDLFNDNFGG